MDKMTFSTIPYWLKMEGLEGVVVRIDMHYGITVVPSERDKVGEGEESEKLR